MRMATITHVMICLVLMLAAACGAESSPEIGGEGAGGSERSVVTVGPPVYLEEVIPPCVPLAQTEADPCALGPIEPFPAASGGEYTAAVTPMPITKVPSVEDIMLGKDYAGSKMFPSLIKHIVIRGTVQVGTTRCHDYYLKNANYVADTVTEGLTRVHCFADVRVNEYLVGEGPPVLPVGFYVNVTTFSDREGYSDREETIAFYGGDGVWIANRFDDPAGRTAQAYEGKEVVLFLGLPFAITLEAFVINTGFSIWFVQRDEDGTVRAVANLITEIRDPAVRADADIPLAELEQKIAEAAANRDAVTGGRIGTDPSLPLLVSDANDLRSHYTDIGAVYVTTETSGEDVEHPTRLPPPAPGGGVPDQPPITTGEQDDGSSGTVPTPGGDDQDQGGNTGGGTGP